MVKRMLIDATHSEETRVVVVNGTRLEEFDVETSTKKQLKGNIYLAKVVRVEPSLQAAFVDYGGNRHGFLAFSEIHPDYYQIPVSDRERLIAEENQDVEEHIEENGEENDAERAVETLGGDDTDEVHAPKSRAKREKDYKIQEVVKRRQIMLVQVSKEERGNKGAALTTYVSLAGRYCVLMPNTARGGGVSRKIVNAADRRRLKGIMSELEVPESMALILRTAGAERSKAEVKRDYEYLVRAWDTIREDTMKASAPALIYEEANLIKRSIRDLYARDIDEILVEGDEGYRLAKDFMKQLTPSHAKKVQPYKDEAMPLFHRYQVESQMDAMHSPIVQLKSGGYIVMNQTEALVAIDVNSGRATRERNIEETAVKTNLEASDEIARQLRLRDMAGLVVVDYIDMDENKNNSAVERRLREALKNDRARIQIGRISHFGLLELSRQRLRPSLMETSFETCIHCDGAGVVRSIESTSVHILRVIEEEGVRRRSSQVRIKVPTAVALYILNQKREALAEIEHRYSFKVFVNGDDSLIPPNHIMERIRSDDEDGEPVLVEPEASEDKGGRGRGRDRGRGRGRGRPREEELEQDKPLEAAEEAEESPHEKPEESEEGDEEGKPRRPRRRGRRGGRRRRRGAKEESGMGEETSPSEETAGEESTGGESPEPAPEPQADGEAPEEKPKRRRAPRRPKAEDGAEAEEEEKPKRRRAPRRPKAEDTGEAAAPEPEPESDQPKRSGWWNKIGG